MVYLSSRQLQTPALFEDRAQMAVSVKKVNILCHGGLFKVNIPLGENWNTTCNSRETGRGLTAFNISTMHEPQ